MCTFLERFLHGDFKHFEIGSKRTMEEKLLRQSLKFNATDQPQLEMYLLLFPSEELLQIWFEAISESCYQIW